MVLRAGRQHVVRSSGGVQKVLVGLYFHHTGTGETIQQLRLFLAQRLDLQHHVLKGTFLLRGACVVVLRHRLEMVLSGCCVALPPPCALPILIHRLLHPFLLFFRALSCHLRLLVFHRQHQLSLLCLECVLLVLDALRSLPLRHSVVVALHLVVRSLFLFSLKDLVFLFVVSLSGGSNHRPLLVGFGCLAPCQHLEVLEVSTAVLDLLQISLCLLSRAQSTEESAAAATDTAETTWSRRHGALRLTVRVRPFGVALSTRLLHLPPRRI
mmetsp:Transcript_6132/g.15133  ORF Transcript_6132/g.15133 Transcript_6132/m.15133 type:complete len:268 (+) Transcript_6132:88-891(+)